MKYIYIVKANKNLIAVCTLVPNIFWRTPTFLKVSNLVGLVDPQTKHVSLDPCLIRVFSCIGPDQVRKMYGLTWSLVFLSKRPFFSSCNVTKVQTNMCIYMALVAPFDGRLLVIRRYGFDPCSRQHSLWRLIMKYFLRSFSPFR